MPKMGLGEMGLGELGLGEMGGHRSWTVSFFCELSAYVGI